MKEMKISQLDFQSHALNIDMAKAKTCCGSFSLETGAFFVGA